MSLGPQGREAAEQAPIRRPGSVAVLAVRRPHGKVLAEWGETDARFELRASRWGPKVWVCAGGSWRAVLCPAPLARFLASLTEAAALASRLAVATDLLTRAEGPLTLGGSAAEHLADEISAFLHEA